MLYITYIQLFDVIDFKESSILFYISLRYYYRLS